jgi:periplasmic protein TonB
LIDLRDAGFLRERVQTPSIDPDAWKRLIGNKPVEARLETLPEKKIRRSALAISSTVQLILAAFVVSLPLFFPENLSLKMVYQVTPVAAPVTEVPIQPEKPQTPKRSAPIPVQPPEPVRMAKLFAPPPLVAPKPKPVQQQNPDIPKLDSVLAPAKFNTSTAEPERPREPVKTGILNTGESVQPTLRAAADKVQTGGFGDPNGFPSNAPDPKHGNVAKLGSFDLPSGPGYGNGTGGANGARGVVASSGFGNGVATTTAAATPRGAVQAGGFGTVGIGPAAKPATRQAEEAPAIQPVVILSKPNPVYTDEARKLGIEGEVLVEVVFQSTGQVKTVRIVKGLGHGLDEAALRAAEQIRFKPALQEGHAVDFPAIAHIVFQLAY